MKRNDIKLIPFHYLEKHYWLKISAISLLISDIIYFHIFSDSVNIGYNLLLQYSLIFGEYLPITIKQRMKYNIPVKILKSKAELKIKKTG